MTRVTALLFAALLVGQAQAATALKFDVQPRSVSKRELRHNDAFRQIPGLQVIVTNPSQRPQAFGVGCGGYWPVEVSNLKGQPTPPYPGLACTQELRQIIIQPGQQVKFPSFSWTKLAHLPPGHYAWKLGQQLFPFTLRP